MTAIHPNYPPFQQDRAMGEGLLDKAEWAIAFGILFLMSGALLAPLLAPNQNTDEVPLLRLMWLPVYGVTGLLFLRSPLRASKVAVGGMLTLFLVGWAFLSYRWSGEPDLTVRRSIALMFTSLFGLLLAATYDWKRLINLFAWVSLVLVVGVYISCLLFPRFGLQDAVHPTAWTGLWYEKNQMGWIMTHGVLAATCAALYSPERRRLWICVAVLCAGAVVMSRSTTSLLGVVVVPAGILALSILRRANLVTLVCVWAGVAIGGAFIGILIFAPDLFFHMIGKDPSLTGRTEVWAAVLRKWSERPWQGFGFGAFWLEPWGPAWFVRHEVGWKVPTAHDGWLDIMLQLGIVGLSLAVLHFVLSCAAAVLRFGRGVEIYWTLPFMALFVLFSVSESTVMQYNGITWVMYIATMAKLFEWKGFSGGAAPRGARAVRLFPDA